jgi:hypothetical protein
MTYFKTAACVAIVLCACSSNSSGSGSGSSGTPSVHIDTPTAGATVQLDFNTMMTDIDGTVSVQNFKVAPVGMGDGQVWIIVDGPQCNDHTDLGMLKSYNTVVPSDEDSGPQDGKSFAAGIDYCQGATGNPATITGKHTITAELHKNDGSLVMAPDGGVVSDSTWVTVTLAPDDGGSGGTSDAPTGG